VQRLASEHAGLTAKAEGAMRDLNAAIARRDETEVALRALPVPTNPALLRATIERIRGEGRLDTELVRANSRFAAAQDVAAATLAALPLWHGDAQGLAACPVPLPAETAACAARLAAAAETVARCASAVTTAARDLAECDADVARLAAGRPVPTPAVVTAARDLRDRTWRTIRGILEGKADGKDDAPEQPREELSDTFEALRDDADQLADQRADEAQRVADYMLATTRQAALRHHRQKALAEQADAQTRHGEAEADWHSIWAPTAITPAQPAAMIEWVRARTEVLKLSAEAAECGRQAEELVGRREAAKADLAAMLPDSAQDDTLASALTRADVACAAIEVDVKTFNALAETLKRDVAALPGLQGAVAKTREALDAWQKVWADAIVPLGLESCTVATAESALEAWGRVAEVAPAWRAGEDRVRRMIDNIAAFEASVAAVVASVGGEAADAAPAEPAPVAAARLMRRLAKARQDAAEAAALTARIAAHTQAVETAKQRSAAAETVLGGLRRLATVADNDALQLAIDRARQRDEAADEEAKLVLNLAALSDGLDEAALFAEAAGTHPDTIVARLEAVEAEAADLGIRREALSAERTRIEATLDTMRHGQNAAGAAQDARHALAEAGVAAERYARLHMARVLLRSGIDRFRRAQQGPMLQAAGRHFASLTGGRYIRLGVDEDAAGRPLLVAVHANGAEVAVEALSEGTRDQLYLALRIAAVQAYSAGAEPLPFIADDLLVHFDDERASAAIRLLTQLGRTTQVILFSHHDHVADLAEAQGTSEIAVHRLSGGQPLHSHPIELQAAVTEP
jgi:uncharacterized protein YhaN